MKFTSLPATNGLLALGSLAALFLTSCASTSPVGSYGPHESAASAQNDVNQATMALRNARNSPDAGIPASILRGARGIAYIKMYKAGLGISGRAGKGLVVARTSRGWSGPTFINTAGIGYGPQIGVQATDFLLVLNTPGAVEAFARNANVTLSGNAAATAGPVGRTASVGVTPIAPIYTYSQSRGLFVGLSLEGSVLGARPDANEAYYGRPVSPGEILSRRVAPPSAAAPLIANLPR